MKTQLAAHLTSRSMLFDEPTSLQVYSFDQGEVPTSLRKLLIPNSQPDLVVQPGSLEDLLACVRFAGEKLIPLVPRGASTFGMGGAVPHHGGILLDFSPRREIYELDRQKQTIRVGAGCRWSDAAHYLNQNGFDLSTYPTSWFSTIGGWASTGGCGIGCTRFGSFHSLIESITVVTPNGDLLSLRKEDPAFAFFLGTEGQMGAIWDLTFRIRQKPAHQIPFLILFDSNEAAMECAKELLEKFQPYHLKFLDASRVHEINHLLQEEHPGLKSRIELSEKPTLLACFEGETDDFREWARKKALFLVSDFKAGMLWRERMFPLRVKRIAPGLLASELILPLDRIAAYVKKASELGRQFGVTIATECYFLNDGTALTLPVYTFRGKSAVDEALKSSLAYVLTQAGIRMGGKPYGIGIWNTPFVRNKFETAFHHLKRFKKSVDARSLFNPGKFFQLSFRTGLAGRMAAFPLHSQLVPFWTQIQPFFATLLTSKTNGRSKNADLILENEELCSKCGSCISVCPAYIDTQDERTTARGKLQLGKRILSGGAMTAEEANVLFSCMHCGACTDVCQSRLDLVPVWDELENRVETVFGKDIQRVDRFVKSVEAKKIMGVPYARGAEILAGRKPE
jgi:FAD/FMN-containing dehydrogenase/NAD-dependent dihydropyrimidine dehydrogenase PreA subunit